MIYPQDFAERVGFSAIRRAIASLATTPVGQRRIEESPFSDNRAFLAANLDRMQELKELLLMRGGFPDEGYAHLREVVKVLESKDKHLGEAQLAELAAALRVHRAIVLAFHDWAPEGHLYAFAQGYAHTDEALPIIRRVLGSDGRIRDDASEELRRIRRALSSRDGKVTAVLNRIVSQGQREGHLPPDTKVVVRDGQPVIPIPAQAKSQFGALVHGHSRGGQTLFIEPFEVLELQNEIRQLREEEHAEIVRILRETTELLRPEREGIDATGELLVEVDVLRAKALYATRVGGAKPILVAEQRLYLRGAQHPLLYQKLQEEGKTPVPLDLTLDGQQRMLIISGPNAGGKSVCLKCVGTAVYMLQCGFLPFVKENSEMGLFSSLLLDIGDAQSMESDLSTYSSHLLSMRHLLEHASPKTLCLIDELGSGTEPLAGGAIAEAVVKTLGRKRTLGVVTTHYGNLKQLASSEPGLFNGSMRYDVQAMRPLYLLEMGVPGSSFAFEIAKRMGLPEGIISEASRIAGSDYIELDKQLRDAAEDRRFWEEKRQEIEVVQREVDRLRRQLEEATSTLKEQRREIVAEARREAKQIVKDANRTVEQTIRTIRESNAEKEQTKRARNALQEHTKALERGEAAELGKNPHGKGKVPTKKKEAGGFEEGMSVRLRGSESVGKIVQVNGKRALVAMGQMITSVELDRLEPMSGAEFRRATRGEAGPQPYDGGLRSRRLNFQAELDVRGMRGEQAVQAVQMQLDDALMVGAKHCRVLHGKGNGILRTLIRDFLKGSQQVAAYADEDERFGGAGITVYEIK